MKYKIDTDTPTFPTPESWKKVGEILEANRWQDLLTSEERLKIIREGDKGVTIDG